MCAIYVNSNLLPSICHVKVQYVLAFTKEINKLSWSVDMPSKDSVTLKAKDQAHGLHLLQISDFE